MRQLHTAAMVLTSALILVSIGACTDEESVAPHGSPASAAVTTAPLETLGEIPAFIEIAEQVPSFGGFWFDKGGTQIVVGLTNPADFQRVVAMIPQYLGAHKPTGYVAVTVARPFAELARYRAALRTDVFGLPGVVSLGVGESANRVEVGITELSAETAVRTLVHNLGIPDDAIAILTVPVPQVSSHTLRSPHPNGVLEDGWQIESGAGTCTLGFVALRSDGSPVFVTASHCTTTSPGYDGGAI